MEEAEAEEGGGSRSSRLEGQGERQGGHKILFSTDGKVPCRLGPCSVLVGAPIRRVRAAVFRSEHCNTF